MNIQDVFNISHFLQQYFFRNSSLILWKYESIHKFKTKYLWGFHLCRSNENVLKIYSEKKLLWKVIVAYFILSFPLQKVVLGTDIYKEFKGQWRGNFRGRWIKNNKKIKKFRGQVVIYNLAKIHVYQKRNFSEYNTHISTKEGLYLLVYKMPYHPTYVILVFH